MSKPLSKIIGITFLTQIGIFLLVFFNNVLVSRWLGPVQFGIMATLLMVADAANKFTNLGLETSILYYVSNKRFPFSKFMSTSSINGAAIYGLGALSIYFFVSLGGLSLLFDAKEMAVAEKSVWWCFFLLFAAMVHEYGSQIWLGLQQFTRYNGNLIFRPFIYLGLLALVYFFGMLDVSAALIIYGASWLFPGLYIWRKSVFPIKLSWEKSITKASFQYGFKIMFANLFGFLIYRSDIFLIGYFLSQKHVGWYYVAVMIAERLWYLTIASSRILFPAVSHSVEQQKKTPLVARFNLLVVFCGAVVLAILAPWIIPFFFSEQYQNSVAPLLILLPGVVAMTLPKVLSADFSARGLPQYPLLITFVNFIINLILNFLLIPRMGIAGAALSSSFSYLVAAVLMCYLYVRFTSVNIGDLIFLRIKDWQIIKNS